MILGSVGCFLVIESRRGAAARGVTPFAHVAGIRTDRCRRDPGQATANARAQLAELGPADAVISAASGASAPTREEAAFLAELGLPVRALATAMGHSLEPAFPAAVAVAALAVSHGTLFPPLEAAEAATTSPLRGALVTGWGHWRGEAMALVETA
jgi:3-oxoacyl-[acyl-carrier-protein] synthase II